MARRKRKAHKKTSHRRVGGLKMGSDIETLVGVIGGMVATRLAKKFIPTTMNAKLVAAVEAVGGGVIAYMGGKSAFIKGLGYGIAAGGVQNGLTEFGLIAGVGGMGKPIVFQADGGGINGFRDVPKVGQGNINRFPSPNAIGRRKVHMAGIYAGIFD
jgi:hypothetical protein